MSRENLPENYSKSEIYNTFKKRKHVIEYRKDKVPEQSLIEELLWKAWHMTPSKQNYYPYTVNILGPDPKFDDEKLKVWDKAMHNHHNVEERAFQKGQVKVTTKRVNQTYQHLSDAPYVIVFTSRVTDPAKTNLWNKKCIAEEGHFSEPEFEDQVENLSQATSLEVGLFTASLTGLLCEQGIDITYTQCFPKDVELWHDLDFVTKLPLFCCSIGYGKYYKMEKMKAGGTKDENGKDITNWQADSKADFGDIINWVKDQDTTGTTDENRVEMLRRIKIGKDELKEGIHA
jgi:hypothetical protein